MSSFQDLGVTHACFLSLCIVIQRCMRVTPLGFCLRVFVNEKRLNLEKTTSSVLSVLLINLCSQPCMHEDISCRFMHYLHNCIINFYKVL